MKNGAHWWLLVAAMLAGCATAENYKPAGFDSAAEVARYDINARYYATRLAAEDWQSFYKALPDMQGNCRGAELFLTVMTGFPAHIPDNQCNVAYAFRWNTLQKKKTWDTDTIQRLQNKELQAGDDVFKIVWALGPPERVLFNNYFNMLLYLDDTAIIFNDNYYKEKKLCKGCAIWPDMSSGTGLDDRQIEAVLGLERPKY